MLYADSVPRINSYSLTDFHDFDECPFRFFVRHHLNKKYEIDEGNEALALGNLLDQAIKKFHQDKMYGCKSSAKINRLIDGCAADIKQQVARAQYEGRHQFYETTVPFLTPEVIDEAKKAFLNYYVQREGKINQSLGEVGFCKYPVTVNGDNFILWGGADALEMGADGTPEVVDYKSRKNLDKGRANMDMDLMPKLYVLFCRNILLEKGCKKARFLVRFWQDPLEESMYEEFELDSMRNIESLFGQKIEKILRVREFTPCGSKTCAACKSAKKGQFLEELEKRGLRVLSGEQLLRTGVREGLGAGDSSAILRVPEKERPESSDQKR